MGWTNSGAWPSGQGFELHSSVETVQQMATRYREFRDCGCVSCREVLQRMPETGLLGQVAASIAVLRADEAARVQTANEAEEQEQIGQVQDAGSRKVQGCLGVPVVRHLSACRLGTSRVFTYSGCPLRWAVERSGRRAVRRGSERHA